MLDFTGNFQVWSVAISSVMLRFPNVTRLVRADGYCEFSAVIFGEEWVLRTCCRCRFACPLYVLRLLAAAAPLGVPSGKTERHPSGTGGVDAAIVSRAGSKRPWLGTPDRQQRRCNLPAGFAPARTATSAPNQAPLFPCAVCKMFTFGIDVSSIFDGCWTQLNFKNP